MSNFSSPNEVQPTPECSIKTSPSKIKRHNPPRNRSWSRHSESSAMNRAEDFQAKLSAEHPSFIKCIIHSHTERCGWLNIPSKFCHKHLPKCDAKLELVDKRGKTFNVKFLGDKQALSAGWKAFSIAHNLEKGDVLVGQLVDKALFKVEVYIIRHNVLAETDDDLGLLELDTCADVTISNDGEKDSNAFAKAQEKHLDRMLSFSPTLRAGSSFDSDDTVEDETYEIDPTDLQLDEEEIEYDMRAKEKGKRTPGEEDNEEASVDGDLDNVLEDINFIEEEDIGVESDNSVECGDHIREELQYDAEELILIREMNQSLRRVQQTWVGPSTTSQVYEEAHTTFSASEPVKQEELNSTGKSVPSRKWPSYWATYGGRYQSDHRDSDDEGPLMNDEDEDSQVEHELVKTRTGERKLDYPFFNEHTDMRNVYFEVGLRFQSEKVLKEAILWYSIQQKKDIRYIKNNQKRINVCCHGCMWKMSAGRDLEHKDAWQIKALRGEHRCVRTSENKLISGSWLAEQFLDKILRNPKMTSREMKDDIRSRYDIFVHLKMCDRAKNNALLAVTNLMKRQYGILKPYLRELCISNPNTHCVLKTSEAPPGQPAIFQKFYVCFDALRKGFVETCRPIIGVDGYFLKHACGGQLLCAVGRDGNNHMYPVAWAVVEVENRSSWEWFLKLVGEDLNIGFGGGWTVISDQQKGLVQSIHALWPNIEHRQCARHIFSNWRKLHKGRELERQFWRCVKATTMGQFTVEIDDLKKLSKDAYDDFMDRDPNTFCKSHFKTHSKCDVVDNNMAETFNSFILLARYKPIVTMFEDIRLALIDRMKEKVSKFVAGVPPRITEKLEEAYDEQKNCECRWNGGDNQSGFEVLHKGINHAVDLEKRTCSCRVWELTGIPCCHAMSAILYMNKKPEDYIAMWYKVETYAQTYSMLLQPTCGNISWDHDDEAGMVLPPNIERRGRGRRKTDRRRDVDECSIKTSPSKIKRDNPPRNRNWSRSHDSKSSAMMRAEEFQAKLSAEYPSFIKYIIHSHTERCRWLNIPSKFCHKHLPKCDAQLELVDKSGKTFNVKYLGDKHVLTAGWNAFSIAHNLEKGDVLVGQLVDKALFKVEVYIIRHNVLAETDGDMGLLELDTCADVTISRLCTDKMLKRHSCKMRLRSSKYAQPEQIEDEYGTADCFFDSIYHCTQSRKSNHPDPSPRQSTSMISDPVLLQATDIKSDTVPLQAIDMSSAPVPHQATDMNSDPVSLQGTIDKTPKHRSYKVQPRNCQEVTRKQPEQIENEYGTADCHRTRSRKRRRANPAPLQSTNTSSDPGLLRGIEMCSIRFGYHLERIWMSFPADKLVDFTYLECLWFLMYRETYQRIQVLSWIKKKNIFSRKYIFVPICIWGHWNLLILCHFGERLGSENKRPFMLLLDSLNKADPMRYGPEIRKFVKDIYKEEGIGRSISEIHLLVPKVPQQKNKECGHFTLYYIKKFIEATLETISDGDLSFIHQNWFSHEELDGFCVALEEESKALELLHSQDMALIESSTEGDVIYID